tara:strand:- start:53 stop:805 length:753 start_codon:yes stop_codon:yes gene_type:complete
LRLNNNFILPKIIGHRGVKNLKPENTLESISKAFEIGLDCVEVDVKISKDGIPLLLHDDTLDRTTNGSGLVCNFSYEEISKLDAGYHFYKQKTEVKVPRLSNVLNLVKKKQKFLNIELKPNKKYESLNVKKVVEEVKRSSYEKIYFSSFDLESCINLKENSPNLFCGFLNHNFKKIDINQTIDICKKYNFFSCGINLNVFSNSIVDQFVNNNIKVTVYADNNISQSQALNLWNNNVTSIFVDDPTEYINF